MNFIYKIGIYFKRESIYIKIHKIDIKRWYNSVVKRTDLWFNIINIGVYAFLYEGGILVDNLGQYIREKREQKKLTIEELSKKTLISRAVLKDIEAGKFDRYEGDEAYVKMYLKKISHVLNLDTADVTQQYIALTKEIELEKLREIEKEEVHNEEVVEKGKKFTFKVPELTRKPSVYEDKSHVTIIKAVIILIIVCLIIVVFWYGFSQTKNQTNHPEFKPSEQPTVEGNVTPDKKDDENQPNDPTPNQPSTSNENITFTRNERLDFSFKLPEGTEKFIFKIEFGKKSWAQLNVNGRNYEQFKSKIYHNNKNEEPEVVELEFNVSDFEELVLKNGYSMGQHYYINNQEVPLINEDMSTGVTNFKLKLDKQ